MDNWTSAELLRESLEKHGPSTSSRVILGGCLDDKRF